MTEIHRRGAFYVTSDAPGVYRVWRDGEPPKFIAVTYGRGAAQRAREDCARCADPWWSDEGLVDARKRRAR